MTADKDWEIRALFPFPLGLFVQTIIRDQAGSMAQFLSILDFSYASLILYLFFTGNRSGQIRLCRNCSTERNDAIVILTNNTACLLAFEKATAKCYKIKNKEAPEKTTPIWSHPQLCSEKCDDEFQKYNRQICRTVSWRSVKLPAVKRTDVADILFFEILL